MVDQVMIYQFCKKKFEKKWLCKSKKIKTFFTIMNFFVNFVKIITQRNHYEKNSSTPLKNRKFYELQLLSWVSWSIYNKKLSKKSIYHNISIFGIEKFSKIDFFDTNLLCLVKNTHYKSCSLNQGLSNGIFIFIGRCQFCGLMIFSKNT